VVKFCKSLATSQWFSLCCLISSTNKTDCHDIAEILLKVALLSHKHYCIFSLLIHVLTEINIHDTLKTQVIKSLVSNDAIMV